jgi:hypothetical protein
MWHIRDLDLVFAQGFCLTMWVSFAACTEYLLCLSQINQEFGPWATRLDSKTKAPERVWTTHSLICFVSLTTAVLFEKQNNMATEAAPRVLNINVGLLGHVDSGKTSLGEFNRLDTKHIDDLHSA